ncbi:hypothetical protein SUGI_1111940 [Cryptomeria japonica]|nr:hypothetical protein SUGI_1111940 [Cryptomeria japonica]
MEPQDPRLFFKDHMTLVIKNMAEDSECAPFDAHVGEVSVQDILDTLFVQGRAYELPRLHELQGQNRFKARKYYTKMKLNKFAPFALHNTTLKHQAKTDEAKKAVIAEEASQNIIIASPPVDDKIALLTKKAVEFDPRVAAF